MPQGKVGGMPLPQLEKAWSDSIDKCPAIKPPPEAMLPKGIVGRVPPVVV